MLTEKEVLELNQIYNEKLQKLLILKRDFIRDYLKYNVKYKLFTENIKKVDLQIELANIEMSIMQINFNINENKITDKNIN